MGTGDAKGWKDGIPGEEKIPVPASFNDFYTDKDIREFAGDFWYETEVFVPGEWKEMHVDLRFCSADTQRYRLCETAGRSFPTREVFFRFLQESTTLFAGMKKIWW